MSVGRCGFHFDGSSLLGCLLRCQPCSSGGRAVPLQSQRCNHCLSWHQQPRVLRPVTGALSFFSLHPPPECA